MSESQDSWAYQAQLKSTLGSAACMHERRSKLMAKQLVNPGYPSLPPSLARVKPGIARGSKALPGKGDYDLSMHYMYRL